MKQETKEIRRINARMKLLIIAVTVVFVQSVVKNFINERWARERKIAACVPASVETEFAVARTQTAAHPINEDAKIKRFVQEYIKLTRNEQIVDFHKVVEGVTASGRSYDKARLSDNKYKSMFMAIGLERKLNEKAYMESTDRYFALERRKMSVIFLIDEILTFPVPAGQITPVIVRGKYEGIFDQASQEGQKTPVEFLGYREIKLLIKRGLPSDSLDDPLTYQNEWGLYVISSSERKVGIGEMNLLSQRSRTQVLTPRGDFYNLFVEPKKEEEEDE